MVLNLVKIISLMNIQQQVIRWMISLYGGEQGYMNDWICSGFCKEAKFLVNYNYRSLQKSV